MQGIRDPIDRALLDDWQRDFPITERPYAILAETFGTSETDVLRRLKARIASGQISRVGATCTPNTISASTLAAIAAPEDRIEEIATMIGAEPGVNHSYVREHMWNLWFVTTGPNRAYVNETLARIRSHTGLQVLDLPLVRPFTLDLGFGLRRERAKAPVMGQPDTAILRPGDREIVGVLTKGLPLVAEPYAALAKDLGRSAQDVMARIKALSAARIIARFGVIVRHRALGWRANAMVVWELDPAAISHAGPVLAAQPGVTLCYERRAVEGIWPYRLYSMIHARSRPDALSQLAVAASQPALRDVPHEVLFSSHCFKQTGALIAPERRMA